MNNNKLRFSDRQFKNPSGTIKEILKIYKVSKLLSIIQELNTRRLEYLRRKVAKDVIHYKYKMRIYIY